MRSNWPAGGQIVDARFEGPIAHDRRFRASRVVVRRAAAQITRCGRGYARSTGGPDMHNAFRVAKQSRGILATFVFLLVDAGCALPGRRVRGQSQCWTGAAAWHCSTASCRCATRTRCRVSGPPRPSHTLVYFVTPVAQQPVLPFRVYSPARRPRRVVAAVAWAAMAGTGPSARDDWLAEVAERTSGTG